MEMEERLIIGITMGDPASIGPEITVKALTRQGRIIEWETLELKK